MLKKRGVNYIRGLVGSSSSAFLRFLRTWVRLGSCRHDLNAPEQLNHWCDQAVWRWHACCGEPRHLSLWNNRRPGVFRESWCGRLEERTSLMTAGLWRSSGVWDATLERLSSAAVSWSQHGLPRAMASEVVCGLVFRLLLPACLAAGELVFNLHFYAFKLTLICLCVTWYHHTNGEEHFMIRIVFGGCHWVFLHSYGNHSKSRMH